MVAAGLGCALWWVCWNQLCQLEPAVSKMGKLWLLMEATPTALCCQHLGTCTHQSQKIFTTSEPLTLEKCGFGVSSCADNGVSFQHLL